MPRRRPTLRFVKGAASWAFASDRVEAFVTRDGGHLAPLRFKTSRGVVEPMAVAPWHGERLPAGIDLVLRPLRGDFFCAPFGGNAKPWRGRKLPAHGESASLRWTSPEIRSNDQGVEFRATMEGRLLPGTLTKSISLKAGETNVYCRHTLAGFSGPLCLGHHAMLAFPPERGPGLVSLGPWREGRVCPEPMEDPKNGGYFSLRTGAPFQTLERVPLADGGHADLSVYPSREGFEDLVMVSARAGHPLGWTAVSFPKAGWLWFALKDPTVLASTILWHSNGGRHYPPWDGRHRRVLGLEEVTSYFHYGQAPSAAPNPLSRKGVPTVLRLTPRRPLVVNYIMGVCCLPRGFDRVASIEAGEAGLVLTSLSGRRIHHPVALDFLDLGR